MTILPGTRMGRYEMRSKIGAGGMGEVYRARDEKLNRDVAIKVLPAALSQDVDRLRRFEQEAQAAGALNHPHILAVYDVGMHDSVRRRLSDLYLVEGFTEDAERVARFQREAQVLASLNHRGGNLPLDLVGGVGFFTRFATIHVIPI